MAGTEMEWCQALLLNRSIINLQKVWRNNKDRNRSSFVDALPVVSKVFSQAYFNTDVLS